MKINSHSIVFKTGLIYFFVTILNILVFVLMVFENQLDLIVENAVLNSMHKGSSLKYRIDDILGDKNGLTQANINKILKEATSLDIKTITLFKENGDVFSINNSGKKLYASFKNKRPVNKKEATNEELKMMTTAITKRGFEDKLFYYKVDKKEKKIDLYIPFTFLMDKIGVASISLEMKDIDKQMVYLYRQCLIMALLIFFIHTAFGLVIIKMLIVPLRKLIDATHSISKGDLDIRVPIVRDDEIGVLASSFNEMSVALRNMRDEAKGANPLTGLPGNITIAKYIDDGLRSGQTVCVLYCDLDNFKAYNDKYGFTKGDEAIMYTRDCLVSVAQRKDMKNIFVGHEGGDDFVVVCGYEYWELYAKAFLTTFDRGIYQFYNSTDARNGFIESVNRSGQRQRFPLMSVSIAVVTNKTRPFRRHAEMIQVAAEVKKHVKSMDGSCYAIDRRQGNVSPTQKINISNTGQISQQPVGGPNSYPQGNA